MANFRIVPGMFVRFLDDFREVKKGESRQVLYTRWTISFVGVNGTFPYKELAGKIEPMIDQVSDNKTTRKT